MRGHVLDLREYLSDAGGWCPWVCAWLDPARAQRFRIYSAAAWAVLTGAAANSDEGPQGTPTVVRQRHRPPMHPAVGPGPARRARGRSQPSAPPAGGMCGSPSPDGAGWSHPPPARPLTPTVVHRVL